MKKIFLSLAILAGITVVAINGHAPQVAHQDSAPKVAHQDKSFSVAKIDKP